jgi:hypothetical protein
VTSLLSRVEWIQGIGHERKHSITRLDWVRPQKIKTMVGDGAVERSPTFEAAKLVTPKVRRKETHCFQIRNREGPRT